MKPFLQGRKTAAETPLRPPVTVPALRQAVCRPPSGDAVSPHVDVIKEGDKVVRLVVTCSCGEKTEIDCLYSGRA